MSTQEQRCRHPIVFDDPDDDGEFDFGEPPMECGARILSDGPCQHQAYNGAVCGLVKEHERHRSGHEFRHAYVPTCEAGHPQRVAVKEAS